MRRCGHRHVSGRALAGSVLLWRVNPRLVMGVSVVVLVGWRGFPLGHDDFVFAVAGHVAPPLLAVASWR